MSLSENTNNQVTGEQIPVAVRAYWTQVAAGHALRRRGGALVHTPEGYECCDFCMHNVPLDSMIRPEEHSPICVCCAIEALLNPPEDKDDAKIWPPSYARVLLEDSQFAERPRRWSDVTEEDLEDPETGHILGVRYVDRVTREEVNLAADAGPSPCKECNYMRILGWGTECKMCAEEERRAQLLGAALASEPWP
jgi:hypothetical protein